MKPFLLLLAASALLLGSGIVRETVAAKPAPARAEAAPVSGTYEPGGPLAGLVLPPQPDPRDWGEVVLYPGAVEHYRNEYFRYTPSRSSFDQQSMIHNWVVPRIPGAEGAKIEQFQAPIYDIGKHGRIKPTGQFRAPATVVRCSAGQPVFQLDLGTLPHGLYVIRVIGAVETSKLHVFRLPLYLKVTVNDGLDGSTHAYRMRCPYVDDFYAVGEFYFMAPEPRAYHAEVGVDTGSAVDLLVHNVTLDNVMAGVVERPIKTAMTLCTAHDLEVVADQTRRDRPMTIDPADPPLTPAERAARDEAFWNYWPAFNTQFGWSSFSQGQPLRAVTWGTPQMSAKEIGEKYGVWKSEGVMDEAPENRPYTCVDSANHLYRINRQFQFALLVNDKLHRTYTMADLAAHRPLPDPYPFKDRGDGFAYPDPKDPDHGRLFLPVADGVSRRFHGEFWGGPLVYFRMYLANKNPDSLRGAVLMLAAMALHYPAMDFSRQCLTDAVAVQPSYGEDLACRQREQETYWYGYTAYEDGVRVYDEMFPSIQGNDDLARAVGQFIPWIKNSKDLTAFFDAYLVQTEAKRILRYKDWALPMAMATVATCADNGTFTEPWMKWLFSRAFIYPLPLDGIQNLMISDCDRAGAECLGSGYYCGDEGARRTALALEPYLRAQGDPQYNLADPTRYPKPLSHCYWALDTIMGGQDIARIGDVTGPEKEVGKTIAKILPDAARAGWKWSLLRPEEGHRDSGGHAGDPRFAWIVDHLAGRANETAAQWAAIQSAAATVQRAPWLDLRSRFVPNWFAALETGLEHDDYRFRRAVYVRTGLGYGHNHADTLDLQLFAHGLPMTVDDGQRSGYSKPNSRFSRIHNVVEVDGTGNTEYGLWSDAWADSLSDGDGARYLKVEAVPLNHTRLVNRQVALIDVDEGTGDRPLSVAEQMPHAGGLPRDVQTADSYVFDVFRVDGGDLQTYCFHAMVNDAFEWNALHVQPVAHVRATGGTANDADYLSIFESTPKSKFAGDCPATLTADWRYSRDKTMGNEQQQAGPTYDPASPRKHTRLHLLDARGLRALRADLQCNQLGYRFTSLMVQKRGTNLQSAFAAIIEPYAGDPFIRDVQSVPVEDNETDARRAVAVQVETANGHHDLLFADGRPDRVRNVECGLRNQDSALRLAAEYAFYSTDDHGLRLAALTGGTQLRAADVQIETAARERTGVIRRADYRNRTLDVDGGWPDRESTSVMEIITPGRHLSISALNMQRAGGGRTRLTTQFSAEVYRSEIVSIGPAGHALLNTGGFEGPAYHLGPIAGQGADDETAEARQDTWQSRGDGPQVIDRNAGQALQLTDGGSAASRAIAPNGEMDDGFAAMRLTVTAPVDRQRTIADFTRTPYSGDDSATITVRPDRGSNALYRIGVGARADSQTFAEKPLRYGQTYVIVWGWSTQGAPLNRLWIDPAPGDLGHPDVAQAGRVDQQKYINLLQQAHAVVDDLQVATGWSEVYLAPSQDQGGDLPQRTQVVGRTGQSLVDQGAWSTGFHAGNDDATRVWNANFTGNRGIDLVGPKATAEDFAPSNAIRVWHYGVGDTVRQPTFVSLKRIADDTYSLSANVNATISLKAVSVERSTDRKTWRPINGPPVGGWVRVSISETDAINAPIYLKIK